MRLLALEIPYWQLTILKTVIVLSIIPAAAVILGYVFLLKMMAHMQSRMGPDGSPSRSWSTIRVASRVSWRRTQ